MKKEHIVTSRLTKKQWDHISDIAIANDRSISYEIRGLVARDIIKFKVPFYKEEK